jgi:phosphoglycolate phosphatase
MKYKCAVFDMDGTILDTLRDLMDALNYALRLSGRPERTLDEVRSFVGNGIVMLIRRAAPDAGDEAFEKLHSDFREWYAPHCADRTAPYEGVPEAVAALREAGVRTAVVSNKSEPEVKALCERFFPGLFEAQIGVTAGSKPKPAPDSVFAALKALGADASEAVYIGDSEVDMQTAANAGLPAIAVAWGFRGADFLRSLGAKTIIDSPRELVGLIV